MKVKRWDQNSKSTNGSTDSAQRNSSARTDESPSERDFPASSQSKTYEQKWIEVMDARWKAADEFVAAVKGRIWRK